MPNDTERAQWVDNDEGLYNWWKSSRQSKRAFIRENRAEIDGAVSRVTGGERPAHYLAYGPDAGRGVLWSVTGRGRDSPAPVIPCEPRYRG